MNWLKKLQSLIQLSEATKNFFKTVTSVIGMIIAIISTRNFMVANKLDTVERIQQYFLVSDNRIEMQKILKSLAKDNKADRAFFMFYEQLPDGQFVSVFKDYYQWQPEGQVKIFESKYYVTKGAATDRKKKIDKGECAQVFAANHPSNDELAIALLKSNVSFQILCPVVGVSIDGIKRISVVGLEYEKPPNNRNRIEANLLVGAVDVAESFNYSRIGAGLAIVRRSNT